MNKKTNETAYQVKNKECDNRKVFDFTEKRLILLSRTMKTKIERDACLSLLQMYLEGTVAIKWCSGSPRYVKIPAIASPPQNQKK